MDGIGSSMTKVSDNVSQRVFEIIFVDTTNSLAKIRYNCELTSFYVLLLQESI
jgi:hypothetical protein